MKKILFVLISIICFCACEAPTEETSRTGERKAIMSDGTVFEIIHYGVLNPVRWYEVEKDNNRHEFVWINGGVAHWPDCKYCKEKQNNIE